MEISLTKDGLKMAMKIYKRYLEDIKSGKSKTDASCVEGFGVGPDECKSVLELKRQFSMKMYTDGSIVLNDHFIVYMENRVKDNWKDAAGFLSNFIP